MHRLHKDPTDRSSNIKYDIHAATDWYPETVYRDRSLEPLNDLQTLDRQATQDSKQQVPAQEPFAN